MWETRNGFKGRFRYRMQELLQHWGTCHWQVNPMRSYSADWERKRMQRRGDPELKDYFEVGTFICLSLLKHGTFLWSVRRYIWSRWLLLHNHRRCLVLLRSKLTKRLLKLLQQLRANMREMEKLCLRVRQEDIPVLQRMINPVREEASSAIKDFLQLHSESAEELKRQLEGQEDGSLTRSITVGGGRRISFLCLYCCIQWAFSDQMWSKPKRHQLNNTS